MKALYIAFEGIEASGKTTQAELLCEELKRRGIDFILTREPGSTSVGAHLRKLILEADMDAYTELMLYMADRNEHIKKVVIPALLSGRWVISDRCFASTVAYQGFGRGIDLEVINMLNNLVLNKTIPDLIFILDIDPEISLSRIKHKDRIESEDISFHKRVREGYLYIASSLKQAFLIDAHSKPEDVFKEIISRIFKD